MPIFQQKITSNTKSQKKKKKQLEDTRQVSEPHSDRVDVLE
jgi:hypothetical protein